jgi:hypothetical protein
MRCAGHGLAVGLSGLGLDCPCLVILWAGHLLGIGSSAHLLQTGCAGHGCPGPGIAMVWAAFELELAG